jgi:hypothetical protein
VRHELVTVTSSKPKATTGRDGKTRKRTTSQSDRWIAEKCAVGRGLVGTMRRESTVVSDTSRAGRDGKTRTVVAIGRLSRRGTCFFIGPMVRDARLETGTLDHFNQE